MVEAGVTLARAGGPDAVVLREVTRAVGVVPNAAYRHFADRDALLSAVREVAIAKLAERMAAGMDLVREGPHTPAGAIKRLRAVGEAYLAFARDEPGLFDTAFTTTSHQVSQAGDTPTPFGHLQRALNDLVHAGVLAPQRREDVEHAIWATVHGTAVLLRGPLSSLPQELKRILEERSLDFIGAAVDPASAQNAS